LAGSTETRKGSSFDKAQAVVTVTPINWVTVTVRNMRVDWTVKVHNEYLLIQHLFIQNSFSFETREQFWTFCTITMMVQACVTVCWEWMCDFITQFRALWMKLLWESLHLFFSLATVTARMLLQRAKTMKFTWCQGPAQSDRWQACCSSLDRSVMNKHYVALTWDQVTFVCLVLRRSFLLITDLTFVPFTKPRVLCVRHTFTGNVLLQMPEPVGWLFEK
jgi:hypothetical protein